MAKPCLNSQCDLSNSKVLQLLQNPDEACISYIPPVKPKGGEIYLFSPGINATAKGIIIILYVHTFYIFMDNII